MHGCEQSMVLTLPPLSVVYLKCKRKKAGADKGNGSACQKGCC